MVVFICRDNFDDMMTCIYDAWASRLGHANVRLKTEPVGDPELFCEYREVQKDPEKTAKVVRSIQRKISFRAYQMIYRAAMSDQEDKLDAVYRFVTAGFYYGSRVLDFLQEPVVMRIFELDRRVSNEASHFIEFIRFANKENNVLVSHIEPKSNVLTLIAPHFADRLPSENWMIVDDTRKLALVHRADHDYYLTPLSGKEMEQLSRKTRDPFIDLWKDFFESTGIQERRNPRCQRTLMPLWYRKNMTEFREHCKYQNTSRNSFM